MLLPTKQECTILVLYSVQTVYIRPHKNEHLAIYGEYVSCVDAFDDEINTSHCCRIKPYFRNITYVR